MRNISTGGGDFSYEEVNDINENFSELDDRLLGWEDLRFPVTSLNPLGSVADADVEQSGVFMGTFLFDPAAVEICVGIAQLPHSLKLGTLIYPHIHWAPTTAGIGNAIWRLEYVVANKDATFLATYTTLDTTASAGGVANTHRVAYFEPIDTTGLDISAVMVWKLSRLGNNVLDTYPADARLLEFDIHYQSDEIGSTEQGSKVPAIPN